VKRIVRKTTQDKPANATHWSTRTMASAVGVSETTVRRIWHKYGLKPHLMECFKISTDPHFTEKLEANLSARAGQFVRVLPFSREGLLFSVDSDTTTNMQVLFNHLT
jgi:hypothetical protein